VFYERALSRVERIHPSPSFFSFGFFRFPEKLMSRGVQHFFFPKSLHGFGFLASLGSYHNSKPSHNPPPQPLVTHVIGPVARVGCRGSLAIISSSPDGGSSISPVSVPAMSQGEAELPFPFYRCPFPFFICVFFPYFEQISTSSLCPVSHGILSLSQLS